MQESEPSGVGDVASPDTERRAALAAALAATGLRDGAAFRKVYQLTSAKLFGICLRICGERQAAEDVLQEVYLIIWRRAASFEPLRSSPITWLATIARNRAIDWRRANGHPLPPPPDAEPRAAVETADDAALADVAMIAREDAHHVHRCLATLDRGSRDAIRAAFLDGATYAELAERAGVPLATMKSRVRRGLLQLRKRMTDDL
ncbi:sigma-70 family RNA polymerase sigma factor [Sphingomonas adhaesiva]|uniref:sigma-70 family RNA polymerase sigma factor n=1 Tax=Sphingomonas adhaesiva TaxID=28212 RepID=UPI002FFC7613